MKVYRIAFKKSFLYVQLKYIKQYIKKDLWITLGLLTSSRLKAKLFSNKLRHPTEYNISLFKMYNNVFNKLKCNMKIQYYKSMLDGNKYDMKKKNPGPY